MDDLLLLDTLRAQISTTQGAEGAPILLGPSLGYHRVQGISPNWHLFNTWMESVQCRFVPFHRRWCRQYVCILT